jgi:hypothetical protein
MEDLKELFIEEIQEKLLIDPKKYAEEYDKIIDGSRKFACSEKWCEHIPKYKNHIPNIKLRKYHVCNSGKIVYIFLKSFLEARYVLIKTNILITELEFMEEKHILYIDGFGFRISGTQINGYILCHEDPMICATLINLVHEYYKKKSDNEHVNFVVENFPLECIKSTAIFLHNAKLITKNLIKLQSVIDLLYKEEIIDENMFSKLIKDLYIKICKDIDLTHKSYIKEPNGVREKTTEMFLSLVTCKWMTDYKTYWTTVETIIKIGQKSTYGYTENVHSRWFKDTITYESGGELKYLDSLYPYYYRGLFDDYLHVIVDVQKID